MKRRPWNTAAELDRADDFRCLGCETPIGRRGYCGRCLEEEDRAQELLDARYLAGDDFDPDAAERETA